MSEPKTVFAKAPGVVVATVEGKVDFISEFFDCVKSNGVAVYTCKSCSKQIVLRSSGVSLIRLVSHAGQHGSIPLDFSGVRR